MKIMTLNLEGYFNWDDRADHIIRHIRQTNPDIILFQEVVYLPEESQYTQVSLLNRLLKYPYYHGSVTRLQPSPHYENYREGLAVLSRLPITTTEALVLKREADDPHNRIVQFIDVIDDKKIVGLANVHLSVRNDHAVHHLEEIFSIMQDRDETRILAGDFNVDNIDRHAASLWRDKYVLSTAKHQYVSFPEGHKTIDYFLVPKEYELDLLGLSHDGLSDHRALTAEIEYKHALTRFARA